MITTQVLLTFEELRSKCFRHLYEVTAICVGGFVNPDPDFLNDEYSRISENLRHQKIPYHHHHLRDAFWSAVFELEHKQKLLPNSLIVLQKRLCRIISFKHGYPVQIAYKVFTKHGFGRLKNVGYSTVLTEPVQRVLLQDPLTKNL
jgi:hypothetical protein